MLEARFEILTGVPARGPLPRWIPEPWRRTGREGCVVRFFRSDGGSWIGNFRPGSLSFSDAFPHPDGRHVLVVAAGEAYLVDPDGGVGRALGGMPVSAAWLIEGSRDLLCEVLELAFYRLGADGIVWHSRPITWNGFDDLAVGPDRVSGQAWSPSAHASYPFSIDLRTGHTTGGVPDLPDLEWEMLAASELESF